MEIPPKSNVGRKPDPEKSTLHMREYWRRRYFMKKAEREAERAKTINPVEEEGDP